MTVPDNWLSLLVAVLVSFAASSGAWALIMHFVTKREANNDLLMGIAYDRIIHLGRNAIDNGYISKDDYEHLVVHLYKSYKKRGGNGLAEKIVNEVIKLPIK